MDVDALAGELERLAAEEHFSGVVMVEGPDGIVHQSVHGWASRTWQVPCSLDTRFDTASITKLFTAVATLQVVEEGAFDLDTDVIAYLGLTGTALSAGITPFHLLTHTSGIADDADEEAGEDYAALFVDRPSYAVRTTADHLPYFVHKPPNFAPGDGCRYCNCGYVLLGLMVERATGRSYPDHAAERIFDPAGMARSGFFAMDEVQPDVAEGADPVTDGSGGVVGWRRNIYSYPPVGSPDGGAHVTAPDLLAFHRALVEGRLLGTDGTAAMLTPKVPYRPEGREPREMGFGLQFQPGADGRVRSYWKEGINAGASGILVHYPAEALTAVVLSNMEDGAWEPFHTIDRLAAPPAP